MPHVIRTSAARDDLLEIGRFIAEESQSLDIALRFLDRIERKCQLYSTQPHMAATRPDLGENVHSFSVDNHVVIYQPVEDGIRVLMVIHGSRDIPSILKTRMNRPTD